MLKSLLKIGEWQSEGKDVWDRFLEWPKERANKLHYTVQIIFELDQKELLFDLKEFDRENDARKYFNLITKERRGQSFYTTAIPKKLKRCFDAFFGKIDEDGSELIKTIEKYGLTNEVTSFINLLIGIEACKKLYIEQATSENGFDYHNILDSLNLSMGTEVSLVTFAVKSEKLKISEAKPIASFDEYLKLLQAIFFPQNPSEKRAEKISYVSGKLKPDVSSLKLTDRDNLNAMFVTTTKNYASNFIDKGFSKNYQVSSEEQISLDFAAKFLAKNYRTKIANVNHIILPQLRDYDQLDLEIVLIGLKKKSDLLFNLKELATVAYDIADETEHIFWINFIAYETDGNSFKSTGVIKDVVNFHFNDIIKAFSGIDSEMRSGSFVEWDDVMSEYDSKKKEKVTSVFNLNSCYKLIPVRKDKEKTNKALNLFKALLENRKIEHKNLFKYFSELILCHYYERYKSYTNIKESSRGYLFRTVRDSVFKYLALIQVLKKLNLIDMDENTTKIEESGNKYDLAIISFFNKMKLTEEQQSMFYLGRMLNAVEWIQIQKKIKKTVINKVNFNGIEKGDIKRLRKDLIDKARQHNKVGRVLFLDRKFGELFDYNSWDDKRIDPNESLFFLLTGYSFGIKTEDAAQVSKAEEIEDIAI